VGPFFHSGGFDLRIGRI